MNDVPWPNDLHQQGNRFYFRARVPTDLIGAFGGKREFKKALGTGEFKTAVGLVRQKRVEFDARCDALRAARTGEASPLSLDQLPALAIEWLAERRAINAAAELQRTEPMTEHEFDDAWAGVSDAVLEVREALGRGDIDPVANLMAQWLQKKGFHLEPESPQYRALGLLMLRAVLESSQRTKAHLKGRIVGQAFDPLFSSVPEQIFGPMQPAAHETASPVGTAANVSVREAAERFWEEKKRKRVGEKTREKYRGGLDLVVAFLKPTTPIASVGREQSKGFLELLRRLPPNFSKGVSQKSLETIVSDALNSSPSARLAVATQTTYFRLYRDFTEWACAEGLTPSVNWSGLRVERLEGDEEEEGESRRAFTIAELKQIFSAPLFTGCRDGEAGFNVPGSIIPRDAARYWLPLLGLWTGARLGELCQLRVIDVGTTEMGTPYIRITDDEPPMRLKTKNARREVPLQAYTTDWGEAPESAENLRTVRSRGG